MTENFNGEAGSGSARPNGVFEDFKAMPLEQKISSLFRMEIETLNEMLRAGANCAMDVFQKVGDTISTFGTKLEREAKAAADANKEEPSVAASESTSYRPPEPTPEPPIYPTDTGYAPPQRPEGSHD